MTRRINSKRFRLLENDYQSTFVQVRDECNALQDITNHQGRAMCEDPTVKITPVKSVRFRNLKQSENHVNCTPDTSADPFNHNDTESKNSDDNEANSSQKSQFVTGYIDEGDPTFQCCYCGALLWLNERVKRVGSTTEPVFSMCCSHGKIKLPLLKPPPKVLNDLFFNKSCPTSKNFLANIRAYNNMFSFTSMGGKIHHVINSGGGPYAFVLNGQNYHTIGSLLPIEGSKPVYSQLYIYDTDNEITNRISAVSRHEKSSSISPEIIAMIKDCLDQHNPYVKQYRLASQILQEQQQTKLRLRLIRNCSTEQQTYNLPTTSEVAALILGDFDSSYDKRDIIVEKTCGILQRIHELHYCYLPLQYPLLFPFSQGGYNSNVKHCHNSSTNSSKYVKTVTIREYLAYRLMSRSQEVSAILHAKRLCQQFVVDGFTMMESQRIDYIKMHQQELQVDLYQGLSDALFRGERNASATGKRVILPSSFTGGARYMIQNYQDAMAICRWAGYPDIFITFTCNPAWPEIQRFCAKNSLHPSDRPDILCRVFKMKLQSLLQVIKQEKIFGRIKAEIYAIEFQKRGLPHAHIILFLDPADKIKDAEHVDELISTEIPNKNTSPLLYDLVASYMIHGPCGHSNPRSPCMKEGKCSKYFPKKFVEETILDDNGYPTYRRRNDGRTVERKGTPLDSRYVVPYNPRLLELFTAHINVEKTNQSTSIKYLFKYISKGNDRVIAGIYNNDQSANPHGIFDEIKHYYDFRYISSCEAAWRIFAFDIHHRYPSVERLSFHLPNQQTVLYKGGQTVKEVLKKPRIKESQFLAWMECNKTNEDARALTYLEFPHYYVFDKKKRRSGQKESVDLQLDG
ncbi:uncharacterized protein LOC129285555 [Prosopis cineraria]|uniref:uncharacterized protein LOC129285555 n=1 Tax=Prosopis cineraria TaxID=364024 RepID=UPI00241005B9|nr:uncharacterized protein LOC129285555 [Prosopis cineraria]